MPKKKQVKEDSSTKGELPKHRNGRINVDAIREEYFKSEHVEWTPFANSMNWDAMQSRQNVPALRWIEEKKFKILSEQSEILADTVFKHKTRWHAEVVETLKKYPELNENMKAIILIKMNRIWAKASVGQKTGDWTAFDKIQSNEILSLTMAVKGITESKYKSLMLQNWTVQIAEEEMKPQEPQSIEYKMGDANFEITVIGGEKLYGRDLQNFINQHRDKPMLIEGAKDEGQDPADA